MVLSQELIDVLPLAAGWYHDGVVTPNARLRALLNRPAEAFENADSTYELFFGDRAAAFQLQHESDRHLGSDAPRLCVLISATGTRIAAEWIASSVGNDELWIFHPERPEGEIPINSYGITQEDVGDMLYWVDEDANIRSVNSSACESMGYTPEELLSKSVRDIDPNYTQERWNILWERIKREKRTRTESRHRKKSGEIMHVDILAQFAVVGGVAYACSTVRDITRAKKKSAAIEQDLAERENLLANLVGMAYRCKVDEQYSLEYVSTGASALTGYTVSEFLARPPITFNHITHPDDLEHMRKMCVAGIASRAAFTIEYRIIRKDGVHRWVQDLARALYDTTGAPIAVEGFITDITPRKHTEEALRESQLLFSSFMDNSPALAFMKDGDGRLLYINNTFVNVVWGGNAPEWKGKHDYELWSAESAKLFREHDQTAIATGGPVQFSEELEMNGRTEYFITIRFPLRVPDGRLLVAGFSLNVSEQRVAAEAKRRMEDQMLHMQKLESLGVLAGGIAHDFNNLLTGIMGYADLALFSVPEDSSTAQSIAQISKSARSAADLTRQMLAYSGRGTFVVQAFSLNKVLRDMTSLLEVAISKRTQLTYDLAEDIACVDGDPTQVRQVLMNLIINASESIGENDGIVRVSTGTQHCTRETFKNAYLDEGLPAGNYVYVEVADSGCGMDAETRKRLFDPFFTTKFAGRGLGMAAVLGIVRSHRAAITVESDLGKGSTFRVYLPICHRPEEPIPEPPQYVNARFKGTILVVDDEPTVRQLASELLKKIGFTILTANDGVEAIEIYHKYSDEIRTVLLDATMPRQDGPETLRILRREGANVRVILSSGYSEANISEQCGDARPDAFIEKPYTLGRLVQVLSSLGQY